MMLKRKLLFILLIIIGVAVLVAAGLGGVYWRGIRANAAIEKVGDIVLLPEGEKSLGNTVTAQILLKCPWHRRPVEAAAVVGKGARLLDMPVIFRQSWGLGYSIWRVAAQMKPFRTGDIPAGKLDIKFNRYDSRTKDLGMELDIPAFKVSPLPLGKDAQLTVASALQEKSKLSRTGVYVIASVVALLAVLIVLWLLFRRGRAAGGVIITPWGEALIELSGLRSEVKEGHADLGICFSKLTDIVRGYLEKRFSLRAPQQTTYEFLNDLNKSDSPLADGHQKFLKEFMNAADLVKFAKLPPEVVQLDNAMDKAETLVNETKPVEEDNERGAQ